MNQDNRLHLLYQELKKLNISLSKEQSDQFLTYYKLLTEWNRFMNLTAITDFNEVCRKHFADSISLCRAEEDIFQSLKKKIRSDVVSIIDVGTGAGFPGIPLKIIFPNLKVTLLDSLHKRVKFLNQVIDELNLKNITPIHARAEDLAKDYDYRSAYDICVSRAVANMSTLSEYCIPFVKMNGLFIPYKSEKITEELKTAERALSILGGKVLKQIDYTLPEGNDTRNLVIIQKIKNTPDQYPRKAGLPSKEPLI